MFAQKLRFFVINSVKFYNRGLNFPNGSDVLWSTLFGTPLQIWLYMTLSFQTFQLIVWVCQQKWFGKWHHKTCSGHRWDSSPEHCMKPVHGSECALQHCGLYLILMWICYWIATINKYTHTNTYLQLEPFRYFSST